MRIKRLAAALVITAPLAFAILPASAAQVNSHDVKKGDTISYDLHAIACPTKVQAVDISIYYDSSSLTYVEGTLETPVLEGAVTNTELDGEIRLNAVSLSGVDLMEDGTLASAEFKVADDSADSIMLYYEVKNFLDEKKTELHDTYTYDVTRVNTAPNETVTSVGSALAASSSVSSKAASSKTESKAPESNREEEIIFEMPGQEAEEEPVSSIQPIQSDIPSDRAIRFDTIDTPKPNLNARSKRLIMIVLCGAGIFVLGVTAIIILIRDRGGKGSHFSE